MRCNVRCLYCKPPTPKIVKLEDRQYSTRRAPSIQKQSFSHMHVDPIQTFTSLLQTATKEIKELYLKLPVDGKPSVHRERVYCYELYHQMRLAWTTNALASTDYLLNGEVDKSGHPSFQEEGLRRLKPDFLLHGPGHMSRNHTVIEVKSANYQKFGLHKDLTTLHRLSSMEQGYKRQMLLVFGETDFTKLIQIIEDFRNRNGFATPLELWSHRSPGTSAQREACWPGDDSK